MLIVLTREQGFYKLQQLCFNFAETLLFHCNIIILLLMNSYQIQINVLQFNLLALPVHWSLLAC